MTVMSLVLILSLSSSQVFTSLLSSHVTFIHSSTHSFIPHPQELAALQTVLQGVQPQGLLSCWDYLAFPLLLITDSIRPSRVQQQYSEQQQQEDTVDVAVPAAQSDRVAEAALGACVCVCVFACVCVYVCEWLSCVQSNRKRQCWVGICVCMCLCACTSVYASWTLSSSHPCPVTHSSPAGCLQALFECCGPSAEADQALAAVQRLAPLLMLPRGMASEEVRVSNFMSVCSCACMCSHLSICVTMCVLSLL